MQRIISVKPFEVVELLARVEVVLRRFHKTSDIIQINDKLTINLKQHVVRYDEQEVALTPKEYDLLVLFAQNPNVALYRETIYERVWEEIWNIPVRQWTCMYRDFEEKLIWKT